MSANQSVPPISHKFKVAKRDVTFTESWDEAVLSFTGEQGCFLTWLEDLFCRGSDTVRRIDEKDSFVITGVNLSWGVVRVKKNPDVNEFAFKRDLKDLKDKEVIHGYAPAMIEDLGPGGAAGTVRIRRYIMPNSFTFQLDTSTLINRVDFLAHFQSVLEDVRDAVNNFFDSSLDPRDKSRGFKHELTPGYLVAEVNDDEDIFAVIERYDSKPGILFAEPYYFSFDNDQCGIVYPPNSVNYTNAQPNGSNLLWDLKHINVDAAWNYDSKPHAGDTCPQQVFVVVIDTGIQHPGHPDIGDFSPGSGNVMDIGLNNWDFSNSATKPKPTDCDGHGTMVAGIIAARNLNNFTGSDGVAYYMPGGLIPLKVNLGGGNPYTDRVNAINYAAGLASNNNKNRYVINLSWTVGGHVQALHDAIKLASDSGALIVVAAGNSSKDIGKFSNSTGAVYPACYDDIAALIPVSALNNANFDSLESSSDFGANCIVAPGNNDFTTQLTNSYGGAPAAFSTSWAAACVSGYAALIWSRNWFKAGGGAGFTLCASGAPSVKSVILKYLKNPVGGGANLGRIDLTNVMNDGDI